MHTVSEVANKLESHFNDAHLSELLAQSKWDVAHGLLAGLTSQILKRDDLESAFRHGRVDARNLRAVVGRTELGLERMLVVTDGRINLPVLGQIAGQGATLVVSGLHRLFPQLGSLGTAIGERLGIRVKISAVLSFSERSGLAPHHDYEHLFVVQLEGSKTWRFMGEPVAPGTPHEDFQSELEDATEVKLNAGDVLFVPAGQAHSCVASRDGSLHIGLMLSAPSAALAATPLAQAVENDPELQRPFMRLMGDDAAVACLDAYRLRLHEIVDALDLEALLNAGMRGAISEAFAFPQRSSNA
jgi:mannose-6-phosphate isomerase-like protein (cupin superfamily)